ncbi:MAG: hypothetical protein OER86_04030 [Phycisphaerae bacterium]|nr:hypothetical protein [Phycisphaerae bacterium]
MSCPTRSITTSARGGFLAFLTIAALALLLTQPAELRSQSAGPDTLSAAEADGPTYTVSGFELVYVRPHDQLPKIEQLMATPVRLAEATSGFVAPRPEAAGEALTLRELADADRQSFHGSAVRVVAASVLARINRQGIIGVFIAPDPKQIDDTGKDLRPEGETALRLLIQTGVVGTVRTLASGERVPVEEGVNHAKHDLLRERSPLQPGGLVLRNELDAYSYRLNRHPGRRVDVAIGPDQQPGDVVVDYLVTETKPWLVFAQAANTGTEETGDWRYRFGYMNYQTTGNDDVLSVEHITSWEQTDAVIASYEAPWSDSEHLRWRVHGLWSQFSADDIGQTTVDFEGEQWRVGGDLIWNFYQDKQLFVDAVAGVRWQNDSVFNPITLVSGDEDFFIGHAGLRMERVTDTATTRGLVDLEWNMADIADTSPTGIVGLGRTGVEDDFTILSWAATHSFFLEPVLDSEAWEDVSTPDTSTLAHEIALSFKGQTSFGDRLIPQAEGPVGGLYTVRGYEESTTAGDSTFIFSAEYRFHLPRTFAIDPDPYKNMVFGKPFRYAPQEVYGKPDWDLIFRAFVDVGQTFIEDRVAFEKDETLVGTGLGLEFVFRRNFNVRVDWGVALREAGGVDDGSNRFHIVATWLF